MLVDITDRKRAEEHQRRLVHEVNHRANNLLTVVQSLIRLTRAEDVAHYRARLEGRITALARSHNLLAQSQWVGADLRSLVFDELAAYMGDDPRIWVSGETIPLSPAAAQTFALMVHELAANAAKFGAMSSVAGRVFIDWRRDPADGALLFRWREEGALPPGSARPGFGGEVIARIARQYSATLSYDWTSSGLNVLLRVPAEEVMADTTADPLNGAVSRMGQGTP
jgi:two-component sensor histidine kinase